MSDLGCQPPPLSSGIASVSLCSPYLPRLKATRVSVQICTCFGVLKQISKKTIAKNGTRGMQKIQLHSFRAMEGDIAFFVYEEMDVFRDARYSPKYCAVK